MKRDREPIKSPAEELRERPCFHLTYVALAMVPELGSATYAENGPGFLGGPAGFQTRQHSEETAREIDLAVRKIVDASFERAIDILTRNRALLEESAAKLLETETLDEEEL